MINTDLSYRVKELSQMVDSLKTELNELKASSFENELWDNNDMCRNWKVSLRTLASWRASGLIQYVQVGSKIWYTKENRDAFLEKNTN